MSVEPTFGRTNWNRVGAATDAAAPVHLPDRRRGSLLGETGVCCLCNPDVPFRSYMSLGDLKCAQEAKNYPWHMMLSHLDTFLRVLVIDLATRNVWEPDSRDDLLQRQMG